MNLKHLLAVTIVAFAFIAKAAGGPVRNTDAVYTQPDGKEFNAKVIGDEWIRIRKTEDGCAIVKNEDGWWCYASYDADGKIRNTGWKIGSPAPADIIASSRQIPYEILHAKAKERRMLAGMGASEQTEALRKQASITKSGTEKITKKCLVLLIQFTDVKFKYTKTHFENLLNQAGYNGTGSVKDYFEDQFGEGWEFSFDVSDIITLPAPVKYYGANDPDGQDIRPQEMVEEACREADAKIDFSRYDQNNDGIVDNVYIFYAGESESENTKETDLIWPHQFVIETNRLFDGKHVYRYACSSEISGTSLVNIGSFCHEYAHTFGLVDLYDTDYEKNGWAAGCWRSISLMDGGNYNNNGATPPNFVCIERQMLGLSEPETIEEGNSYTLSPIHIGGQYYRMDTDTEGEYFLFECRSDEGWDRYIGGKGMLVYHIDKNKTVTVGNRTYSRWEYNQVNSDYSHQCADLIEADGRNDFISFAEDLRRSISGIFFPQDDITEIRPDRLEFWNGKTPEVMITSIRRNGNKISFNVTRDSDIPVLPTVINESVSTFPDAAMIWFESSDPSLDCVPSVLWKKSGSNDGYFSADVVEYPKGRYACKIEGLESGNISYESLISFDGDGHFGRQLKLPFMTKRKPGMEWPYIYVTSGYVEKTEGILLHVVNAVNASEIRWSYNGKDFTPDKDYRFHPQTSGTLKTEVLWEDGNRDIIIKELVVR